jgi:hypothetical protein
MNRPRIEYLLLFFILTLIMSCASASHEVGRKFDISAVDKIQIGRTTEVEVISLLGEPLKKQIKPDGTREYGYGHVQSTIKATPFSGKGTMTGEKVSISFDKNGVVSGLDRRVLPGTAK